jgi:hypothetical protein
VPVMREVARIMRPFIEAEVLQPEFPNLIR